MACWFWQAEYIQSHYSAVFFCYVTSIGTSDRIPKPQDPGEPKEPLVPTMIVPHLLLLLLSPPVFLILGLPPSSSPFNFTFAAHPLILPLSLIFLLILSSPSFLRFILASPIFSSLFLLPVCATALPFFYFLFSLFGLPTQQSLSQNPRCYPKPPTPGLFILSVSLVKPSSVSDSHAP